MLNFKFDPTITLGSILTIGTLLLSAGSGVWYVSANQTRILDRQERADERLHTDELRQDKMEQQFVRADVRKEQDALIQERFDQIVDELKSIRVLLGGTPRKPTEYWRQ